MVTNLALYVSVCTITEIPTLGLWSSTSCQISGNIRLEIKCIINVMSLNHPETIPLTPQSVEKLSSMELMQNYWVLLSYSILQAT